MFYFFYNCFFKYLITIYCLYSVSVIVCLRYKNCHSYLTFNNKESRKCLNNGYKNIKISRKIYVEGNKKLLKDNEILESCKDGYFENYKKKKIIRTLKNGINKLFFANRYLFGNIGFEEKAEQNNKDSYDKEWKEKKMNHDYYDIKKLENSLNIEPDKIWAIGP